MPSQFLSHETYNLKFLPQSVIFLASDPFFFPFNFPSSRLLGRNSTLFEGQDSFSYLSIFFCAQVLQLATIHQLWSQSLSRITRAFSAPAQNFSLPASTSPNHVTSSHVQPSPSSELVFLSFINHFGPAHFPCICKYLRPLPHLMHRYLLTVARHTV